MNPPDVEQTLGSLVKRYAGWVSDKEDCQLKEDVLRHWETLDSDFHRVRMTAPIDTVEKFDNFMMIIGGVPNLSNELWLFVLRYTVMVPDPNFRIWILRRFLFRHRRWEDTLPLVCEISCSGGFDSIRAQEFLFWVVYSIGLPSEDWDRNVVPEAPLPEKLLRHFGISPDNEKVRELKRAGERIHREWAARFDEKLFRWARDTINKAKKRIQERDEEFLGLLEKN